MKYERLFEETKIGNVEIKNRFFLAPMFPFGLAYADGKTTKDYVEYYVERAKGGTGLIITGLCKADNTGEVMSPVFHCVDDPMVFLQTTKDMVDRIHSYGSKVFLQISAGWGRALWPQFSTSLVTPDEGTGNRHDLNVKCRQITKEEIQTIIKKFGYTAYVAKLAGFDGVEVHALHEGYLLDQFGMEIFNHRTDEYGGNLENRYRFAVEILESIKKSCGKDFATSIRYSPKHFMRGIDQGALEGEDFVEVGRDMEEGIYVAKLLEKVGYDALNVDVGCYDSHYWNHPTVFSPDGLYLPYAKQLKDAVNIPILCAGRMDDPEVANEAVCSNKIDMVGLGRPLLSDPSYVNKLQRGEEDKICWCINCNVGCGSRILTSGHISCALNPRCAYENDKRLNPIVGKLKKLVIVGAGPGGMEAACIAAERGHNVLLIEKSDRTGGNLHAAAGADFKYRDEKYAKYFENRLKDTGVEVMLNTVATMDLIKSHNPDVIINATGATPVHPKIKGQEKNNFVSACEVLQKEKNIGENIVVIGGGQVGVETAIWLSQSGKKVAIVEMLPTLQGGPNKAAPHVSLHTDELLRVLKMDVFTGTKVSEITETGVVLQTGDKEHKYTADTVIYAVGFKPEQDLYNEMKFCNIVSYNIGDSSSVANIYKAVHDGFEIANNL